MSREFEHRRIIPPPGITIPSHLIYRFFDHSITFSPIGTGNDWLVARSSLFKLAGNYSMFLATKRTLPRMTDFVYESWWFSMSPFNMVDISTDWLTTNIDRRFTVGIEFGSNFISKTEAYMAGVFIESNTGRVFVSHSDGRTYLVETLGDIGHRRWVHVEMSVDLVEKRHKSVRVGSHLIDTSRFGLSRHLGFWGSNWINLIVYNNADGVRGSAYFDNLIVKSSLA
ncbi:MAG: hypothetical protein DDT19_02687 [Syntrophomonadaceae bacterium]|nr:hypothetical protein [Bacillota bacterium]